MGRLLGPAVGTEVPTQLKKLLREIQMSRQWVQFHAGVESPSQRCFRVWSYLVTKCRTGFEFPGDDTTTSHTVTHELAGLVEQPRDPRGAGAVAWQRARQTWRGTDPHKMN